MTTQYSPILKLALPVQGELSGTWGDVVNDNITSMVEQAIAGRAVINTWTTNSHTLTSANGTTSESRCAMLELTDTGTALSGAGTVVCPTASKIYIVKNAAGQNITVKTSGGTGILVPDGRTTFLFCDGTNVVEALTHTTSLQLGTSTTVTAVLDEDNMASDSATSLATQQSIKAYVDAQVGANNELSEVLANGNTSGANDIIVDNGQKITTNTIDETTAGSGVTIDSVLLKDDGVNATNLEVTNIKANDGTAAGSIADSTGVVTVASAVLTTADINGGTADGVVIGGATPAAATVTTATANTSLNIAGTVTVTSILDEDNMSSDDPAGLATQQSIKAYVDSQVGTVDTWSEVLANGNTSGATDAVITAGQKITTDTIEETTADAGVTIDSVLLKDDVVNATDIETSTISANDGTTAINIADSTGAVDIDTSLNVDGTITSDGLTVDGDGEFNNTSSANGGKIYLDGTTANAGDDVWDLQFRNTVSGIATDENAGSIRVEATNARRQYDMIFARSNSGTQADAMRIEFNGDILFYDSTGSQSFVYDEDAGITINSNQDARDFTVKSDNNAAMLYVNGASDLVGIGHSSPSAILDVKSTTAVVSTLRGTTSSIAYLDITNYATSAVGAGSGIEFRANSSTQERQVGFITADWTDNTDATRDSRMDFHINMNGGTTRMLKLGTSDVIVNGGNHDTNFQVNSVNQDNMLFVDAGNDQVSVNGTQNVANAVTGDNVGPKFVVEHSTATSIGILRNDTSIVSGNSIGSLGFYGTDTTSNAPRALAAVQAVAAGTHGAGDNPTELRFYTTPDNSETLTERVTITRGGELQLGSDSAFDTESVTTSATTQTTIHSFNATTYTGAKFLVCVTDSTATERYITELLVTHDGTTAVSTEYGQVATDTALATFDVDISSGAVRLRATPASTNSMTFKVMSTQLLA